MEHAHHHSHHHHHANGTWASWRMAMVATLHCLTGCAIGEVLGLIIGTALGLSAGVTVGLSVALAFASGYALTMRPLVKSGMTVRQATRVALAADTASIGIMEVADNLTMVLIPGAMAAGLADGLFWGAMAVALAMGFVAAVPLNRWLISRGKGHAVAHAHHAH